MQPTVQPIKKSRELPRAWKTFFRLKRGETYFQGPNVVAKSGPFWARDDIDRCFVVLPWHRVRTTTLVRDALPGGKSGPEPIPFPKKSYEHDRSIGDTCLPGDGNRTGPSA